MYLVEYTVVMDDTSMSNIVDVINISNLADLKIFINSQLDLYLKIVSKAFQCAPEDITVHTEENMDEETDSPTGYTVVFELEELVSLVSFYSVKKTIFSKMHKNHSLYNYKA